jgi:UDP:flavonoid glycosyltransferase YjiC (YdhE family)
VARSFALVLHDAGGTVPPMLALAEALRDEGCAVTVLSQPSVAARATAIGCSFVPFSALGDYDPTRWLEDQLELTLPAIVGPTVGDDLIALTRSIALDGVIVDANLTGALAAAELVDAPSAVLLHSMYKTYVDVWFGALWPMLAEPVNDTRHALGVDAVDGWRTMFERHDLALSVVSAAFDAPVDAPLDNARHCGFLAPRATGGAATALPQGDKPLALVSLSTTYQDQPRHLGEMIETLAPHARLLVTTAGHAPPITGSAGVVVSDYVPHAAVLPSVDVVVSHAGLGTVTAALAHGVPLVCHPFGRDQHLNAQRVEAVGAGVAVTSAAELADAVQRVVADNGFRAGARQQAELGAHEGGPAAAAELLLSLAG